MNEASSPDRFGVVPTPDRIRAHPQFTGAGVTIAMLDSGFQPHPDLTKPKNRILAFVDANRPNEPAAFEPPVPTDWHGTQTSCAAAGDGFLSGGRYRSAAPDARVVLVRIGERGRISDEHIARGIEWVVENRERYRIDVVNISAGGDDPISYTSSVADITAEEAVRRGLVVVVAAGNAGFEQNHQPMPPANSPSVITVGGYDDNDGLRHGDIDLYRSSFGRTVDGLLKPEIVAPAAWVAAPILEGTEVAARSAALLRLATAPDSEFLALSRVVVPELGPGPVSRDAIDELVRREKIIAPGYQHVDGTSFASPIVASVVAQMIEANPDLKPAAIKHILLSTARRLTGADLVRQGYGMLDAYEAVEGARRSPGGLPPEYFALPLRKGGVIRFFYLDALAKSVALVGNFNGWNPEATPLEQQPNGLWATSIENDARGVFRYKFFVDGSRWVEDPNNWMKIEGDVGGLDSVLVLDE